METDDIALDPTKEKAEVTFSAQEIVQMATVMNSFSGLLENSNLINTQLLLLQKEHGLPLDPVYVKVLEKWIEDFKVLKLQLEIVNSKATMH